jgi:hypothetical protein
MPQLVQVFQLVILLLTILKICADFLHFVLSKCRLTTEVKLTFFSDLSKIVNFRYPTSFELQGVEVQDFGDA